MTIINSIEALEAIYGEAVPIAVEKVLNHISPLYKKWIEASKLVILSTVGPEGTDASPRGDEGAVVRLADPKTILLPDWRGNNRIDSLRNIVRDGRVSLMFMVTGSHNVVRVNGRAILTDDETLAASFERKGVQPKTVIVITVEEVYVQCAKALMRSSFWGDIPKPDVPSVGDFLKEVVPDFDGEAYDQGYAEYAKTRMW